MNNNQISNEQNNLNDVDDNIENLDDTAVSPVYNNQDMSNDSQTNSNQDNFDSMTGMSIQNNVVNNQIPSNNKVPNSMPVQNQTSGYQQYDTNKKNNSVFIVIVAVLLVIILGLILYIAVGDKIRSAFSRNTNEPEITNNNNSNNNNNNSSNNNDNNNNGNSVVNNNSVLTLEGYEFQVPQGFEITNSGGLDVLLNKTYGFGFALSVTKNLSYNDITKQSTSVKSILETKGIIVNGYNVKKFGDKDWLVFNYTKSDINAQYSFTALGANDVLESDYYNARGTITDEQAYTIVNDMINTAKNNGESSFSKNDNNQAKGRIANFNKSLFE